MIENFDLFGLIGGGTLGSIATMITQKLMDRKRDKTDVITTQVKILNDVNDRLNEVVDKLQEVACYRKNCNERLNGENLK